MTEQYTIDDLFNPASLAYIGRYSFPNPPSAQNSYSEGVSPAAIASGETVEQLNMGDGYYQSSNFVTGSTGWRLSSNGDFEGNSGTFRGALSAASGTIGGFNIGSDYVRDVANSFGLASTVSGSDDVRFWAGDTYANRATALFRVTEAGVVVAQSISIGGTTRQFTATDQGIFSFGDGSDGSATFDGSGAVTGWTRSGSTYTADRDTYFTNATVSTGVTLKPNGYRIFGLGTLTLNGTAIIQRDGNAGGVGGTGGNAPDPDTGGTAGSAGSAGSALADGYLKGSVAGTAGGAGGAGKAISGDGNAGSSSTAGTATTNSVGSNGVAGGTGGNGGQGGGGGSGGAGAASGAGGTATKSNVRLIANWHLATLLDISSTGSTVKFDNSAGSAGGGGGGSGTASTGPPNDSATGGGGGGGGAGSSGGILAIYFRSITVGASASITATGGAGGNGGAAGTGSGPRYGGSGGGGGGAGGNGGQVILVYNSLSNSGTISAAGGSGGTGGAKSNGASVDDTDGTNGATGTTGTAGNVRQFQISL